MHNLRISDHIRMNTATYRTPWHYVLVSVNAGNAELRSYTRSRYVFPVLVAKSYDHPSLVIIHIHVQYATLHRIPWPVDNGLGMLVAKGLFHVNLAKCT